MKTILTEDLDLKDVPSSNDPINSINRFALTYYWEELGNKIINIDLESDFDSLTVSELRYVLYIEQRRWNHFGKHYDFRTEQRIRLLIKKIKEKLDSY